MPHFKDGTKARLFDRVKGKFYSPEERSGVLVSIIEGATACNGSVLLDEPKCIGALSIQTDDGKWVGGTVFKGNMISCTIGELELVERVKDPAPPAS